ncbi:porin family protein [Geothrix fuzhouensis]|uniref:porin family protein n=1 Tax=Geothrix fuzhouensis TaxID=2966451 RepID=UPI002148635C|nr:porin family protein [Geothrix fuzhouensis]
MTRSILSLLLLSALALPLSAQDNPGGERTGIGVSYLAPVDNLESVFNPGFQVGFQIHFNRESRHLGRFRMDYLRMDAKRPVLAGALTTWNGTAWVYSPLMADSRMEAYSVAYEWMPHVEEPARHGLFGIFGVGGTLWNETMRAPNLFDGSHTDTKWGLTLSGGAGWRFNPTFSVEARYVYSDLTFHQQREVRYGATRSFLTCGATVRF